jgi:hypothetical protein
MAASRGVPFRAVADERGPALRQGALVAIVGYVLMFGTGFTTFGELVLLVWLVGWGTRLKGA